LDNRLRENDIMFLSESGFRILSYPGLLRYTVVGAAIRALEHLKREGTTTGIRDQMSTVEQYFDAVDLDRYLKLEKDVFEF